MIDADARSAPVHDRRRRVVHAGTEIGDGCVIEAGAVLGKRPRLRPGSSAAGGELGPLVLEPGVTVCCGAIVYAGARIGAGAIIGDQAAGSRALDDRCRARSSAAAPRVDFDARVGAAVLIQTACT